jgi:hypothetical protein
MSGVEARREEDIQRLLASGVRYITNYFRLILEERTVQSK